MPRRLPQGVCTRARAQAEAEKRLPGKEPLRRVEVVRDVEPEKRCEKQLERAKMLR
jgi:hypothetical protein